MGIIVERATVGSQIPSMPCDLSGGTLSVGEQASSDMLALPLDQSGDVELKLNVMWGGQIVVRGARILAIVKGEPEYVERFR
jgi:hypothetical protein